MARKSSLCRRDDQTSCLHRQNTLPDRNPTKQWVWLHLLHALHLSIVHRRACFNSLADWGLLDPVSSLYISNPKPSPFSMASSMTSLPLRQKRPHSAVQDSDDPEQEAKKGRYIPCTIKGYPPFPEANNKVYLIQADVECTIPLTPNRLTLNELEQQHYQSRPLICETDYQQGTWKLLGEPREPGPLPPSGNGLMVLAKPYELKMYCEMPKRSEAPVEIRELYISEEQIGPDVYWSETETESCDGRLGLPYCDDSEQDEDEGWDATEDEDEEYEQAVNRISDREEQAMEETTVEVEDEDADDEL